MRHSVIRADLLIIGVALIMVVFLPEYVLGLPVIQELLYDDPGADGEAIFTEIFGPPGMNLDGWKLVGVNGTDGNIYRTVSLTGAVIPSDGILVIVTSLAAGNVLANQDFIGNVDWQNGPDAVQLRNSLGNVIDALQYGDAGANNAGEGAPAPLINSPGQSLSRDILGTDANDNLDDFIILNVPTPGIGPSIPSSPVPEPETILLLGTSLICWLSYSWYRWRRVSK